MRLYHGTSDIYQADIMEHGLTIKKHMENKLYNSHNQSDYDTNSIHSLTGIYMSTDIDVSRSYAEQAAKRTNGSPLILEIDIPEEQLIIDEDSINISLDIKEFLRSAYMSTDNDGLCQLKNMILDTDTRELMLTEFQSWFSLGYNLKEDFIEKADAEKIVINFVNRMAAHCYGYELALNFLTEEAKLDIPDIFEEGQNRQMLINKYENIFMTVYDEYIKKYSDAILSKKRGQKEFRSITDIPVESITIVPEHNFKM